MGVMVSSSHVVSAAPSSSGGRLLTLFPCSRVRSLSWETVLHKLLQRESFPQAASLHELPQRGSFPRGAALQEQAAPAWDPHGFTRPASKPAPVWAPLSTGLQVLAGACSSTGSPQGHSFLQASTCSSTGSLPQATGGDLLHHGPPWAAGGQPASTMVFIMGYTGKLSSPASRALTLVSAELFLSHLLTPLSQVPFPTVSFFPFLNMLSQRCSTVTDWLGLGQRRVHLTAVWHWLYQTWGKLIAAFHRSHPYSSPSLPKPCHANP